MLATARDHKRAFDGDTGPNTGGMGAFSPADNWSAENAGAIRARSDGAACSQVCAKTEYHFRGLLFPGLMMTADGARVLEFNCRFGDPETQAILPRLKSDLLPLLEATIDGKLEGTAIEWDERAAVTVVLASGGYPGKYEIGKRSRVWRRCSAGRAYFSCRHAERKWRNRDGWRTRSRRHGAGRHSGRRPRRAPTKRSRKSISRVAIIAAILPSARLRDKIVGH